MKKGKGDTGYRLSGEGLTRVVLRMRRCMCTSCPHTADSPELMTLKNLIVGTACVSCESVTMTARKRFGEEIVFLDHQSYWIPAFDHPLEFSRSGPIIITGLSVCLHPSPADTKQPHQLCVSTWKQTRPPSAASSRAGQGQGRTTSKTSIHPPFCPPSPPFLCR